jgi:tetratricopeptide (TPR) repeat protein
MRKTFTWLLLFGALGCGKSDPIPEPTSSVAVSDSGTSGTPQRISPEQAVTMAQDLIKKQNIHDATLLLTEAIRANPNLVEAYTTRASLLGDAKLYTQAVRDMDAAVQLQPDNAQYRNTRGYFHLLQQNDDLAMEDFNQAIALDLKYAQPLNNRGLVRIAQSQRHRQTGEFDKVDGDLKKAVHEFDSALRLDPEYVDAHNNRGFALSHAKQYDEAIASFTRAIALNNKYVNAWNNRAQAHAQAGHHDQAIADFTQAIELLPLSMEYYSLRAESYLAAGKPELARQDLDHVEWSYELDALNRQLNAAPKDPLNWVARGDHLQQVARWEEAVINYNDALKLDSQCLAAQAGLAAVLFHQGKADEALTACNTLLKSAPNREAYSLRGDILFQQGQYDGAIADYKASGRFDSLVAQAYLKRSEQRQASGEIQQASADLVQAVRMDPSLRTQAPEIVFPEDEAPAPIAPGAFPVEAAAAAPLDPVTPVAVEPVAPTTP